MRYHSAVAATKTTKPRAPRAKKPAAEKPAGTRKRRGVSLSPTGLAATELPIAEPSAAVAELIAAIVAAGGAPIGAYREPLGGHDLVFAALPVDRVDPTPFQRDVSDAHVRKLTVAMDKTRRFLDPIIVTREGDRFWTPNGNHRLTALKELGARAVIALVVPDRKVAYQILALNIEKAHNLRERAFEVVRMFRDLCRFDDRLESECVLEFEEPQLVTLGFAYEKRPRLSGGAYAPVLKKVDGWIEQPLAEAAKERERRAALVLELDDAVGEAVDRLKARGLQSPYLRSFVVARINPLRFQRKPTADFDETIDKMLASARRFDPGRIKVDQVARAGGPPDETG